MRLISPRTIATGPSRYRRVVVAGLGALFALYLLLVGVNSCNTGRAWVELPENDYWYCWDTGIPRPHHFEIITPIGEPAPEDHLCTAKDVKDVRNFLYPPWVPDPWR